MSGVFCVACKEGYYPKYSTLSGLTFKVAECLSHSYCEDTTWWNLCENCQNGAAWYYSSENGLNFQF